MRAKHINKNSVSTSKVADGSLLAADFAAGQLPQGPKGDKGAFDASSTVITVQRTDFNLPARPGVNQPGAEVAGFTDCPAGQKIIGGSVNTSSPSDATVLISRPSTDNGNGGVPGDDQSFAFWKGTARTETNVAPPCACSPSARRRHRRHRRGRIAACERPGPVRG